MYFKLNEFNDTLKDSYRIIKSHTGIGFNNKLTTLPVAG